MAILFYEYKNYVNFSKQEIGNRFDQTAKISDLIFKNHFNILDSSLNQLANTPEVYRNIDNVKALRHYFMFEFEESGMHSALEVIAIYKEGKIVTLNNLNIFLDDKIIKQMLENYDVHSKKRFFSNRDAKKPINLLISNREIIDKKTGEVKGHIVGATILNSNFRLLNEIRQETGVKGVILLNEEKEVNKVVGRHFYINNSFLSIPSDQVRNENGYLYYKTKLQGTLDFLFITSDDLFEALQSGFYDKLIITLFIGFIFILFFYFFNKYKIINALFYLKDYIQQIKSEKIELYRETNVKEFDDIAHSFKDAMNAFILEKSRMELAIKGSKDGIWDWDIQKGSIYFSPQWISLLGLKESEIEYNFDQWERLIHPDDLSFTTRMIETNLKNESHIFEVTHRLRHKNGDWVWILDRGKVLFDKTLKPIRMVGFSTDITRQKEQEKHINEVKELLNGVMNAVENLIFFKDLDFKYTGCNRAFEKFVGLEEAKIIGKKDKELFNEETEKSFRGREKRVLQSGEKVID